MKKIFTFILNKDDHEYELSLLKIKKTLLSYLKECDKNYLHSVMRNMNAPRVISYFVTDIEGLGSRMQAEELNELTKLLIPTVVSYYKDNKS